ncbi:hypothetical protein PFISCL1PPCAC_7175 [Pristionchus fissidentatus]|uniref:Uncharacterized protein n=1 Tax=Pristionchus fissidentatus TaxID=1538716 RepID=A0AAV5VCD7_9BILA|nr:hypothetical protein PFISCL1PPCAC_7175 [Pristionchus fissidentatus]
MPPKTKKEPKEAKNGQKPGKREQMSSMLRKVFKSRKRKSQSLSSEEAIGQLREIEEMLMKKQAHFEGKIEAEVATAREAGTKNKRVALAALKRKKMYETELARIDGVLTKLEAQRTAIENAGMNTEVLNVLGQANKTLKKSNQELDIDKVSDLMDNIAEQLDQVNEFNNAISQPLPGATDMLNEDDLEAELAKLQGEDMPTLPSVPAAAAASAAHYSEELPDVPSAPLTRASKAKIARDDSMSELEAWAAAN